MSVPASPIRLAVVPLPTARPRPTQTPAVDWRSDLTMGQSALPGLPALPTVALDSSGSATNNTHMPNQPIPFETVSCSASTVRIAQIVTGAHSG